MTRSQQMLGYDSNYVPGWDCHGLPIEWKIEEENYRSKNKKKPDLSDPAAMVAFRQECRAYAQHWLEVQREEFKRLGVEGDWAHPYTTMSFPAEAQIARELMKFAANGTLYRGSKPVMWSVVEKTALAEAEVEYEDYTSDTVWVKFPVIDRPIWVPAELGRTRRLLKLQDSEGTDGSSVVIWTTTPWTLPGNRAISFSPKIDYGLYRVTDAPPDNWAKFGDAVHLADKLAGDVFKQAKVASLRQGCVTSSCDCSNTMICRSSVRRQRLRLRRAAARRRSRHRRRRHRLRAHRAWPWPRGLRRLDREPRGARSAQASTRPSLTPSTKTAPSPTQAPGFTGKRVINDKGEKGDANEAVIKALVEAGNIIARGRLKHQYPHSWRSKKPVIFRNTPQWFIAMDKPIIAASSSPVGRVRQRARCRATRLPPLPTPHKREGTRCDARSRPIKVTRWVPPQGENRITGMIESRPDWVISRQRAWGVPIAVFVKEKPDGSVEILQDPDVELRIVEAFEKEGADAWYKDGARERFLGKLANDSWKKVDDILDVWFDSGSTHAFVLEDPKHFPTLAGIKRKIDGGKDTVMYLEGSDQHRGWFHSSLLESCGTRGRAPFDVVLTHGFVLDEQGRKMSKSTRQRHRAAGRHQAIGRRYSAHVGLRVRLLPTTCASARRSSRPRPIPIASCATPCAGCWARWRISTRKTASSSTRCRSWSG